MQEERQELCKSVFQDGSAETDPERFTHVWMELIQQLEATNESRCLLPPV
ncbi:MAG: hypothetical protein HFF87_01555 [Oscillibacter sp.]|jgi:hypothetical protein|nr:hypothetical protein [Oscillibacter sp.]